MARPGTRSACFAWDASSGPELHTRAAALPRRPLWAIRVRRRDIRPGWAHSIPVKPGQNSHGAASRAAASCARIGGDEPVLVPKEQVMNPALLARVGQGTLYRAVAIIGALTLMSALAPRVEAEEAGVMSPHHGLTADEKGQAGDLVKVVRQATERFKDVEVAKSEGYGLAF